VLRMDQVVDDDLFVVLSNTYFFYPLLYEHVLQLDSNKNLHWCVGCGGTENSLYIE